MSDKISKIIQWSLYELLILSAILGILFYTDTLGNTQMIIYWGYVMAFLVLATLLFSGFLNFIQNPKGSIKLLIALGILIVIAILTYALSKNTYSPAMLEEMKTTASSVRLVGAGLLILYLMGIGAIGVIIYTTVSKLLK